MMRRVLVLVLPVVLLTGVVCGQVSAISSATRNWEVIVQTPIASGTRIRSLNVDQSNGDIYAWRGDAKIAKYDKNGALLATYGPAIKDAGGTTQVTIPGGGPSAMAVDPLTGYLYMNYTLSGTPVIHVVDVSGTTAVWIRSFDPAMVANRCPALAFSDDGQKLYAAGIMNPGPVQGARQFVRSDAGTPGVYTDDTFAASGLDLTAKGTMPVSSWFYPAGVTVDRDNKVYIADCFTTGKVPQRRFPDGVNAVDLEFLPGSNYVFGCSTDAANNYWICDYTSLYTGHTARCYSGGLEVFSFDTTQSGGGSANQFGQFVVCDRANNRVITYGLGLVGGVYSSYLQSWNVTIDIEPAGTITGKVVDAGTSSPVTTVSSLLVGSPYGTSGVSFYGVDSSGTYSCDVRPGLYSVKAFAPGYTGGAVTHYAVTSGATTTAADILLLPADSDYVTISMGAHNVEQGVFLLSTAPDTGTYANFADVKAGIPCRGFGRVEKGDFERYMGFNVDDGFIKNGSPQSDVWIEIDLFDDGPDRFGVAFDTSRDPSTVVGYSWKEATNTWKTMNLTRPDAFMGNRLGYGGDMTFGSLWFEGAGGLPAGPDFISKITFRKTPTASSYMVATRIAELKQFLQGQQYFPNGAKYAGGRATKIDGKVVTASWPEYFYIEEADQSCGIRVVSTAMPSVGSTVNITGYTGAAPETQELSIIATLVEPVSTAAVPGPVFVIGKAAGGGPVVLTRTVGSVTYRLGTQSGMHDTGASLTDGTPGTPNVGLLVKAFGKVTATGTDLLGVPYIYIDDGSGIDGEVYEYDAGPPIVSTKRKGVKVIGSGLTATEGQYVVVEGIMSMTVCDPDGIVYNNDEYYYPVILMTESTVL